LYHYREELIRHKPTATEGLTRCESQVALIDMPSIPATEGRFSDETLANSEELVV
jgi:hypothetical protein